MSERRLKAKCVEANVNVESLAKALNMSVSTYYRKLAKNTFTVNEVIGIANCLHLNSNDVVYIFFNELSRINATT